MAEPAPTLETPPARVRLLRWGVNPSTEGDIIVDERTLAVFAATQRRKGREDVALDFEHNTVEGTPEYNRTHEPRAIAAMGRPVVIPGEGLFLENLTWTETGRTAHGNFSDVSAAAWVNGQRVVTGLHSAALTRTGAVYGAVKALSVPERHDDDNELLMFSTGIRPAALPNVGTHPLSAAPCAAEQRNETDTPMADTITLEALSARLAEALKPINDRLAALEALPKTDLTPLSARLTALETAETEAERRRLIPLFAAQGQCPTNPATGKAYTADELAACDLPTLRVLSANTPRTVPLSAGAKPVEVAATGSRIPAQQAAVAAIQKRDGCTFDTAFARAKAEQPGLFI